MIVVLNENHRLDLYDNGRLVKSYKADMGYRSIHDKTRSGDAATPEGRYRITVKKPSSTYYRALALNYPNEEDRAQFEKLRRAGLVPRWASPGSLIEIHGEGGRGKDWTRGCVAVSNRDMDDLFRQAKDAVFVMGARRLVVQPGMTGSLVVHDRPLNEDETPYAVLRATLDDGRTLVYRDVRRLGTLLWP